MMLGKFVAGFGLGQVSRLLSKQQAIGTRGSNKEDVNSMV